MIGKRLMTENSFSYARNRSLRELLARRGIRHLTTEPYRPRTNGKVERFHQTIARELGLRPRLPLPSTPQRRAARLARQLQPPPATQLTRRPTTDQPRSQRPWAGQLEG
jgi:transposase